jgi:hypothetical protein
MRGLIATLALCAGCNTLLGVHGFSRDGGGGDDDAPAGDGAGDAPGDGPLAMCDPTAAFGQLQPIVELDASPFAMFVTDVSADGRTLYLASDRDGTLQVYISERTNGTWGTPKPLYTPAIENEWITVDATAQTAVLGSSRATTQPELYYAEASGGMFDAGVVPVNLHSNAAEVTPRLSRDRLSLYFGSRRNGSLEIYHADIVGRDFMNVAPLDTLGTVGTFAPAVTGDELVMYFSKTNTSGVNADVYRSERATVTGIFGSPQFVSALNSSGDEIVGAVSPDGCTIYINRVDPGATPSRPFFAVKP